MIIKENLYVFWYCNVSKKTHIVNKMHTQNCPLKNYSVRNALYKGEIINVAPICFHILIIFVCLFPPPFQLRCHQIKRQ